MNTEGPVNTNDGGLETDEESIDRNDGAPNPPETGKQTNKQVVQGTLNTMLRESNFLTVSEKALQFGKHGSEKRLLRDKFDY